jgi:putative proteasome-type protease
VSMDSTVRSNLSVGPPIELRVYERDRFVPGRYLRFEEDAPYLRQLGKGWNQALIDAFGTLPEISWES